MSNFQMNQMLDLRVAEITDEVPGIRTFHLRPCDGALPPWAPGAHIAVRVGDGLVRQYSLCGDPEDRTSYRISVLREPESRGGSEYLHTQVSAGDVLEATRPRNHFELVDAENYLFVAAGIGITPILPMVAELSRRRRPWRLIYAGRSRTSMAFLSELDGYASFGRVEVRPRDVYERVDLSDLIAETPLGTALYCCGPSGLLDAIEAECSRVGRQGDLHMERFAGQSDTSELEPKPGGDEFDVVLARTGITCKVPSGSSILSAIREHVPDLLVSCEEGYCGTCEVRVLSGVPDHRDDVLSDEERAVGDAMMICVGRALTKRIEIDL